MRRTLRRRARGTRAPCGRDAPDLQFDGSRAFSRARPRSEGQSITSSAGRKRRRKGQPLGAARASRPRSSRRPATRRCSATPYTSTSSGRAAAKRRELSQLFRTGRISLLDRPGLPGRGDPVAEALSSLISKEGWAWLVKESLIIGGWVALWRPLEIFLYDWWPDARRRAAVRAAGRDGGDASAAARCRHELPYGQAHGRAWRCCMLRPVDRRRPERQAGQPGGRRAADVAATWVSLRCCRPRGPRALRPAADAAAALPVAVAGGRRRCRPARVRSRACRCSRVSSTIRTELPRGIGAQRLRADRQPDAGLGAQQARAAAYRVPLPWTRGSRWWSSWRPRSAPMRRRCGGAAPWLTSCSRRGAFVLLMVAWAWCACCAARATPTA